MFVGHMHLLFASANKKHKKVHSFLLREMLPNRLFGSKCSKPILDKHQTKIIECVKRNAIENQSLNNKKSERRKNREKTK